MTALVILAVLSLVAALVCYVLADRRGNETLYIVAVIFAAIGGAIILDAADVAKKREQPAAEAAK